MELEAQKTVTVAEVAGIERLIAELGLEEARRVGLLDRYERALTKVKGAPRGAPRLAA